jgi:AAA15 family ATPase/GTPase
MLIAFKMSNFLSFDEPVEFVMRASGVRDHSEHVIKGQNSRYDVSILKSALIYGANASGKSNFIKAVEFAREIIVNGLERTAMENKHFRLDKANLYKPTQFEFEFKHNGKMYAYGVVLSLNNRKVQEEWLFELLKTTDRPVFERKVTEDGKSEITIGLNLNTEDKTRFEVYKKDIRDSQLFLAEINDKNLDDIANINAFVDAYDWFKHHIVIIYPETRLKGLSFVGNDVEMQEAFCHFLRAFKTGVQSVETVEEDTEGILPPTVQDDILNQLNEKGARYLIIVRGKSTYTFSKSKDGALKIYKLQTKRNIRNGDDEMASFEVEEESDGTRRVMDFIPALVSLARENKTYLIDEIERSLHPELVWKLFEYFFSSTKGVESQLIATTHQVSLLDFKLLRRDEIWFVKKDQEGASQMYSLEEFKPRHDKEVRKAYLQGRFSAIPFISHIERFPVSDS